MKIKSGNRPAKPKPVMYICNRKRCKNCVPDCKWTSDINYALYDDHYDFAPELSGLWERVRKQ